MGKKRKRDRIRDEEEAGKGIMEIQGGTMKHKGNK